MGLASEQMLQTFLAALHISLGEHKVLTGLPVFTKVGAFPPSAPF